MGNTSNTFSPERRKRLTIILSVLFAIAMIMGPGPGIWLVNGDPTNPDSRFIFAGIPILYLWAVGWFFVQAAVVLVAYLKLWDTDDDAVE